MTVEDIRGTDLRRVTVRYSNKEDARYIAFEVARAYKEFRGELYAKQRKKGIEELKRAVRDQESLVEERRNILTTITRSLVGWENLDNVDKLARSIDPQDLADAKSDLETDEAILEQMKLRLTSDEIARGTSGGVIVVHEDPVIADTPVSPNVTLNLVIGLAGGVLISPFLALPLMWMMNRRSVRVA